MKICVDGKKELELPEGSKASDVVDRLHLTAPDQALAVVINGVLSELSAPLAGGDEVRFLSFSDPQGKEIFWHTSAHLLAQAVLRLWPEAKATIGPPIEQGFYYDFANLSVSEEDFVRIEQEIEKILSENLHVQKVVFPSKQEAKNAFAHNSYKCELIEEVPEGVVLSAYRQGDFFDLCRGPHLGVLGKIKAFKILKTSGAYWRGDPAREMLTRIYAISFPDKKQLKEYLLALEEAKKRDHKIVGPALDLFSFKEEAPGLPFFHPRGVIIWNRLVEFVRDLLADNGYVEIKTPQILSKELWERSGHWAHYRENMYTTHVEEREFAIKPMSCPGCMLYYRGAVHSYREFPWRVSEVGHVHRFEPSGALNGLFRVRGFHQDDAHIFMRRDQIREEILQLLILADKIYETFGLPYRLELSTRPVKSIGSDEDWNVATQGLKDALDDWGHAYRVNEGDGAFYGPKIDIHIRDVLGRFWQCGTIQLDFSLPQKFSLEYVERDGSHQRPVMLHRALLGSVERFFGILIEHFYGRFPLWLSPYQIRIVCVADRHVEAAKKFAEPLRKARFLVDIDDSNESVGKKVRMAQLLKTNYVLTIGDREAESGRAVLRTRDGALHGEVDSIDFLDKVVQERDTLALMSPYACNISQ